MSDPMNNLCECEQARYRRRNETCPSCTADALEAAEAKFAAIAAVHVPSIGIVPACCFCDELWPCTHHRILHPKEGQ